MPVFRKPSFAYDWDVDEEVAALRAYPTLPDKDDRAIPAKADDVLLLATWNIANLGAQDATTAGPPVAGRDHRVVRLDRAMQEVNDNLSGLRGIQSETHGHYRVVFSDPAGNRERFAYALRLRERSSPTRRSVRSTIPAADLGKVKLGDIPARFVGFDRNPMLASFRLRNTRLLLANVHLYFGQDRDRGRANDERGAATPSRRNGAGAPSDGTAAGPGHGPAGARGGRDRLVGRQAQTRSALLHPRRDRARRLQPPSAGARRPRLRRTHP